MKSPIMRQSSFIHKIMFYSVVKPENILPFKGPEMHSPLADHLFILPTLETKLTHCTVCHSLAH